MDGCNANETGVVCRDERLIVDTAIRMTTSLHLSTTALLMILRDL